MKIVLIALLLCSFSSNNIGNDNNVTLNKPNHSEWDVLVQKYVSHEGNVNYKAFAMDKKSLQNYLAKLAMSVPDEDWSQQEKLAYYINLYNAATVELILDHYPVKSIKDIRSPWDKKRVVIGKALYSLGQIEHKILRKMNEPRIHFAINCASYSCPKLLNVAFTSAHLEAQLEKVTSDFINDTKRNKINADSLQLSQIFKWYKDDFTDNTSLMAYVQCYSKIKVKPSAQLSYLEYNWSLNEIE